MPNEKKYVIAIDQGTTSTRAIVFDHDARIVATGQREHQQIFPAPGLVEHDALEIWASTREVIGQALSGPEITRHDVAAIGVTNQRETVVVWEKATGRPIHNAIVWQDTRTQDEMDRLAEAGEGERIRRITGLPMSAYFSGSKLAWILDNVDGARERAEAGELLFGTMDTWLVWNLSGGAHVTDVTNASRTMLMDIASLEWSDEMLALFRIPLAMLPSIRSSAEVYGEGNPHSLLRETPIAGILGDQQAATFGQVAFSRGQSKNSYGTGNFVLLNTGDEMVRSEHGLITTVAYRLGEEAPVYALEGSIAVTGSLIQWLRDNLGIISSSAEVEELARSVDDNGDVHIVPAFSGLFAPHWRSDARGAIVGLTRFATKAHFARAALEAVAFQSREVIDAMNADAGVPLSVLHVDGGMVHNELLMQFQADILGLPVVRPVISETTSLGAAFAAGLAVGFWRDREELGELWAEDARWEPRMSEDEREARLARWRKAVERTLDWAE